MQQALTFILYLSRAMHDDVGSLQRWGVPHVTTKKDIIFDRCGAKKSLDHCEMDVAGVAPCLSATHPAEVVQ